MQFSRLEGSPADELAVAHSLQDGAVVEVVDGGLNKPERAARLSSLFKPMITPIKA
jgi:hypothetical protein